MTEQSSNGCTFRNWLPAICVEQTPSVWYKHRLRVIPTFEELCTLADEQLFSAFITTFCVFYFSHHLWLRSSTVSVIAHTNSSSQNTHRIYLTVILLHACCTLHRLIFRLHILTYQLRCYIYSIVRRRCVGLRFDMPLVKRILIN